MKPTIPERIPKELVEAPIWTLSGASKIPLDPYALIYRDQKRGFSPKKHQLMPLEKIWAYLQETDDEDLKAAMRVTSDLPYVVVDIEPEGMISGSPYFKWPYVYLEYSRNYGMHGILPFSPPEEYAYLKEKFMIKDPAWESEVLVGKGHFATFTFNEQPLNQTDERRLFSASPLFQEGFAEHLASKTKKTRTMDSDAAIQMEPGQFKDLTDTAIGSYDQSIADSILESAETLEIDSTDDPSHAENRKILQIYNFMIYRDKAYLSESNLESRTIPLLWSLTKDLIPAREKHSTLRDSADYGEVPWLGYVMLGGIEYIRNSALNDEEKARWVKQ